MYLHAKFGEVWRNFGEPTMHIHQKHPSHPPEFRRRSPAFTRVLVKVPQVCGWPLECAQFLISKFPSFGGQCMNRGAVSNVLSIGFTFPSCRFATSCRGYDRLEQLRKNQTVGGSQKLDCQFEIFIAETTREIIRERANRALMIFH